MEINISDYAVHNANNPPQNSLSFHTFKKHIA